MKGYLLLSLSFFSLLSCSAQQSPPTKIVDNEVVLTADGVQQGAYSYALLFELVETEVEGTLPIPPAISPGLKATPRKTSLRYYSPATRQRIIEGRNEYQLQRRLLIRRYERDI